MLVNICETATIVPGSKKSAVSSLNVYRPVALTPILMKCLEKLVVQHIKDNIPASQDLTQHVIDILYPLPSTQSSHTLKVTIAA